MKHAKYIPALLFLFIALSSGAQTVNWASLKKEEKHIINLNTGAEHGIVFGAGYTYQFKTKWPLLLHTTYSFPAGASLTDDFKTKIGAEMRLLKTGNFQFSGKILGVFRQFQNSYARLLNFGSDISVAGGYYKKKWFAGAEVGFDKAIVTHFKHTAAYKANYPSVQDGWFDPSTGGNLYYGIRGGVSFKKQDIYLRFGKLTEQDLKTSPLLPFYGEMGVNFRLRK